ncbi:MAG TPA: signal recognition particle-docking protein FtsY [Actinomycetota bacterium]|nr:signal recognition particle-docking protein FtsY [Actinomycetota bacterium]
MPEGMVPELLVAAGLALLVGIAFVAGRRRGGDDDGPEERGAVAVEERPESADEPVATTAVDERPPAAVDERPPAAVDERPVAAEAPAPVRPSLRDRLSKSRRFLGARLSETFGGGLDDDTWDDLEAVLIQADVGVELATAIVADVRRRARDTAARDDRVVKGLLADALLARFDTERERTLAFAPDGPTVWLVVGVNGTGKTTTIGKLAADLRERGRSVAVAAADTFRAAADEQLGVWAERAGATLVKHQPGADPGAVAYDAHQHARARGVDVLVIDTAGRLHTKTPLMDELAKIRRVVEKDGAVHEVLLVIDATAGGNGLAQAREFAGAVGVTGVVLTKLDGTAKGGIALAIENSLDIPIKLIGVGEGIDDLEPFDPKTFVDALLS